MLSQARMELEVSQHLGAERHERSSHRTGQRNGIGSGSRPAPTGHSVGSIDLKVPRVQVGGFFPSLLEPRKRAD